MPAAATFWPPEKAQRFYSALRRAFIGASNKIFGNPAQIKAWLNTNAAKLDVKKDEIYWSGVNEWLVCRPEK
jgi:hypothetical protein